MHDVPLSTVLNDISLQFQAHGFAGICFYAIYLTLHRTHASSRVRALVAVLLAVILMGVQPLFYATKTQPMSIAIASLAFMNALSFLHMGLLEVPSAISSAKDLLFAIWMHPLYGVIHLHRRRTSAKKNDDIPTDPCNPAPAAGYHGLKRLPVPTGAASSRPVIHVQAFPCKGAALAETSYSQPPTTHLTHTLPSSSSRLLSEDFDEPTATIATACLNSLDPFLHAVYVIIKLIVFYDVGFALLCCSSGCMCGAAGVQQAAAAAGSQGLLGALLGPKLARYAFTFAAGMLLPMQMGLAYAYARLAVIVMGHTKLADSMPTEAFNHPILASSISDLWSNRWHQFLNFYFTGIGYKLAGVAARPILALLPQPLHKDIIRTARVLTVFALSGALHEYLTWAAFGTVTGKYMAFFMLNGLAVLAESFGSRRLAPKLPAWLSRVWALSFMVLCGPLFVEPYQQHGYFHHTFHPFMWPVTASIARRAGVCSCS